jgi:UTRA domain
MPTPEKAGFLRLTPPQPVFFLVRTTFDANDRPVETCEHVMSGDRWQLSYAWQPIEADARKKFLYHFKAGPAGGRLTAAVLGRQDDHWARRPDSP